MNCLYWGDPVTKFEPRFYHHMSLKPSTKIHIGRSRIKDAGRGVFANKTIHKDELIERCPIILIEENQTPKIKETELNNYYFMWGDDKQHHQAAICLGFGSIYNHSYSPNTTYKKNIKEEYIDFVAIKDIEKDEEITVNYNYGNPNDKSKLWIKSIPAAK